ncbi:hypothetical protein BWQ96_03977 [Gracilariopsis chorda]|uniref:Uncharacterized protein n=1 Tax=Gracilariopsis chorda TaxID=448386 RepID=A0A2V3IW36_9FLOR|nr:hypothetical protein BWQ96_03977 [Gracilariopsis chorda]|eukprot:PXF46321.1 hypothetical protein BWQ96_03977 [Gracilariopsis chorda]
MTTRTFLAVVSLVLVLLVSRCRAEEPDLQSMSSAQLADLEKELSGEVGDRTKQLESIRQDIDRLKTEQTAIDEEAQHLQGAREWELKEKEKREKELEAAKNDVRMKQESISRMSAQVASLKDHIQEFEARLQKLNQEKDSTERRFHDPTLADVLESRSQNWGNVSRNVFNKTMTNVVPVFSDITETARNYRRRVSRTSRFLELLISMFIYAFIISAVLAIVRIYSKVKGKLTISRMLFLGDTLCACFWFVMLLGFAILFDDPLYVMKQRSPTPFFLFQLLACFSYVNFVLLRVLVLASKMTLGALGETLGVVVVGHHYYVRVWQPAILDRPFRGTFFYYFCYCWMFCAFAYSRIQEFAPLKQLRGPKLPPLMWLRVLFARFTARGVPDGDIESTPYEDSDDETHEH